MEQSLNEAFLRAVRDRDVDRLEALLRAQTGFVRAGEQSGMDASAPPAAASCSNNC